MSPSQPTDSDATRPEQDVSAEGSWTQSTGTTAKQPPHVTAEQTESTTQSSTSGAAEQTESTTQSSTSGAAEQDSRLIEQTKQQIRNLIHEITQLAQSDVSPTDFYDGFLTRVVSALAGVGGAVWTLGEDGRLELQYQINLSQTGLTESKQDQARHALLLRKVITSGQATLAPPHSGSTDEDEAGNPTKYLLVLGTLKVEQQVRGIVEIFQRSVAGPTIQRGYQRFLMQMCDLASDFLQNRQLRHYSDRQSLWEQLEKFIRAAHRSLDPHLVAYTIANEARRLIGCDRVSVVIRRGKKCRVQAVSGLDDVDHRSETVKLLAELAQAVVVSGEPVWYTGDCEDLPPQIEGAMQAYVDESHSRTVAVLPLAGPAEIVTDIDQQQSHQEPARVTGALIVEQIQERGLAEGFSQRVDVVAHHSSSALANALEHDSVFLMPLWRALGKASWMVQARNLPKTVTAGVAVLAVLLVLLVVPADFELTGRGTLQPVQKREIYTAIDGKVVKVLVRHGKQVEAGDVLARLKNNDIEVAISGLIGDKTATQEKILSVQWSLLNARKTRLSSEEQSRLAGQLAQQIKKAENLDQQLDLYRQKENQLVLTSPIRGQVVTWRVHRDLIGRPVQKGQVLMTVADTDGEWELEIMMPENRMGHVGRAQRDGKPNLDVSFVLATHPGERYVGQIRDVHIAADPNAEQGNTVLIRVAIDKQKLPDLRPGATVTAKIHCGRQPIGYVWFHDVIEFIQAKVLFRL